MDELGVRLLPADNYKVCNGVTATHCAMFEVFGTAIHIHRPVDDQKRTRVSGWQFSVKGVPISYTDANVPRIEAAHSFVIRSISIGTHAWLKSLRKTLESNRRRLDEAQSQQRTA